MKNYQIIIEYLGTKFVGWQKQRNGQSVQSKIEMVLKKITNKKITIFGAGRTDSGVHALGQSAHFKTDYKFSDKNKLINSINFFLSKSEICVLDIKKRHNSFHARHSAKKRIYKYIIINRLAPLVVEKKTAWHVKKKIDINLIKKGAKWLKGTKDFSTYRSSSCSSKSPIKTLEKVEIKKVKDRIEITFTSKSFLQQQVRSMVGCLKYLGEKKWDIKKFKNVMISKNRLECAPPAPACGLFLLKIKY